MKRAIFAISLALLLAGCGASDNTNKSLPNMTPSPKASGKVIEQPSADPSRKPSNNLDVSPTFKSGGNSALDIQSTPNKLPDFIPAQEVVNEIKSDLGDAGLKCVDVDPKKYSLIDLPGSTSDKSLASCSMGDPLEDGFVVYVVTERKFVDKYNAKQYVNFFNDFQSPIDGLAENTLFTPSLRAVLFVLGGKFAFQASEIAWGSLDGLQLEPPSRD